MGISLNLRLRIGLSAHLCVVSPIGKTRLFITIEAECKLLKTRNQNQAVARIADRTASQHLWGPVTSSVTSPLIPICHFLLVVLWKFGTEPVSLTVSEVFNVECYAMVDMTLIRPLNKGQDHSFWYQSISYRLLPIGCQ